MGYGLEVYSTNGNTLNISKDYCNLSVCASGYVKDLTLMRSNIGGGSIYRYSFPASIKNPLPAVQLDGSVYATVYDTETKALSTPYFEVWVEGTAPTTMKYFLFSAGNDSGKSYGRRIYNPDTGMCVFDSCLKYMRILGVGEITTTETTIALASMGRSGSYSRIYVGNMGGNKQYEDSETFSAFTRSGSSVVRKTINVNHGTVLASYAMPDGYISQRGLPQPLILNVTNY